MLIITSHRKVLYVCCCLLLYFVVIKCEFQMGLRFILSLNSICKGIKLYLHKVPDIVIAVYNPLWLTMSNLCRYIEKKSITGITFEGDSREEVACEG
jgi:hypothetical protein